MALDWGFASDSLTLGGTGEHRIADGDARRQTATARAILEHLRDQPGIVLADEVGMGKTYVALAVIASVLLSTRKSSDPIVVMVPPGLAGKWQREWEQFKANCVRSDALAWMARHDRFAKSPTEFFKLLDDPRERRARLVWLTTSCFAQGLGDGWAKLALVRLARRHTKTDDEGKKRLFKWATTLTQLKSKRGLTPDVVERLMVCDPLDWKGLLVAQGVLSANDDDPVPEHPVRHADDREMNWRPLIDVLRSDVPGRRGQVSNETLRDVRVDFNEACQKLYWSWLRCADWRASLLVLDEAHHAKNDHTNLASLFRSSDMTALVDGHADAPPIFWRKAERMLFLTATPFQRGHHELIRVLRSFAAVRWSGDAAPAQKREALLSALQTLDTRLSENRLAARRLDGLWGRLTREHIGAAASDDLQVATSGWWTSASTSADAFVAELRAAVDECRRTKHVAEQDAHQPWNGLRRWVIRHNRPTTLPHVPGAADVARRVHRLGSDVLSAGEEPSRTASGLPIAGASALPFLLAARAQTELALSAGRARAYFAEGLSSSYEAFHHTRAERTDVREGEEAPPDDSTVTSQQDEAETETVVPLDWYEDHVATLVPNGQRPAACFEHPKMMAVVERAVALWLSGEKVLIFCFYRETAKALRNHLRREVDAAIARRASERLQLPSSDVNAAHEFLGRIARRFSDKDSPLCEELARLLGRELDLPEFTVLLPAREKIVGALAAYVRSPAFLARYFPFELEEVRAALADDETRSDVIRHGTEALRRSFEEAKDSSGLAMRDRVREFLHFATELSKRGATSVPDEGSDEPEEASLLEQYLRAVTVYVDHEKPVDDDDDDRPARARAYRALPTVRMVYGQTRRDIRERLMLAFNSPLFPEILVSSAVLGEGVDLHRFCRHILHHDLCWNPSTLEQRTGRLDRIRCKAEGCRHPIVVYEPFLAGSADEKMFRVVRDRERWFQVVMGQKFALDERTTEKLASRIPLPTDVANQLIFDLREYRET